jgi:hypothetical protein
MEWMNEMGEMIAVDAPEMEDAYEAMVDTATALLIEDAAEAEERWGASMDREIGILIKK